MGLFMALNSEVKGYPYHRESTLADVYIPQGQIWQRNAADPYFDPKPLNQIPANARGQDPKMESDPIWCL